MTNKEIEKFKQEWYRIMKEENPDLQKGEQLKALAGKLNAPIPVESLWAAFVDKITRNIHITLQTEEMFNACIFAKWSCIYAAVAAIVACISIIITFIMAMLG
jgi:hypothetical protein